MAFISVSKLDFSQLLKQYTNILLEGFFYRLNYYHKYPNLPTLFELIWPLLNTLSESSVMELTNQFLFIISDRKGIEYFSCLKSKYNNYFRDFEHSTTK